MCTSRTEYLFRGTADLYLHGPSELRRLRSIERGRRDLGSVGLFWVGRNRSWSRQRRFRRYSSCIQTPPIWSTCRYCVTSPTHSEPGNVGGVGGRRGGCGEVKGGVCRWHVWKWTSTFHRVYTSLRLVKDFPFPSLPFPRVLFFFYMLLNSCLTLTREEFTSSDD